ncbi:MAG: hypothetical protein U0941_19560 [Planctomycetaceae bacterium]
MSVVLDMVRWANSTDNLLTLAQAAALYLADAAVKSFIEFLEQSPSDTTNVAIPSTPEFQEAVRLMITESFSQTTLSKALLYKLGQRVQPKGDFQRWVADLIAEYTARDDLRTLLDVVTEYHAGQRPDAFLLRRCYVSEERGRVDLIGDVDKAIKVLSEQLVKVEVKSVVERFRSSFELMAAGLHQLAAYKELHEILHLIQKRLPTLLDAGTRFPNDIASVKLLNPSRLDVRRDVIRAREIAVELPTHVAEQSWIDDLDSIVTGTERAWRDRKAGEMQRQLGQLPFVLLEMHRIDSLMAVTVSGFPIKPFMTALQEAEAVLLQQKIPVEAIKTGRTALEFILPRLLGLSERHTEWQWLDKEFAGIELNPDYRPEICLPRWPRARERLENIWLTFASADWAQEIRQHVQNWEKAARQLQSEPAPQSPQLRELCELEADSLRACTMNQFFEIDSDLREQSEQLSSIGRSMSGLLQQLA